MDSADNALGYQDILTIDKHTLLGFPCPVGGMAQFSRKVSIEVPAMQCVLLELGHGVARPLAPFSVWIPSLVGSHKQNLIPDQPVQVPVVLNTWLLLSLVLKIHPPGRFSICSQFSQWLTGCACWRFSSILKTSLLPFPKVHLLTLQSTRPNPCQLLQLHPEKPRLQHKLLKMLCFQQKVFSYIPLQVFTTFYLSYC